MKKTLLAAFAFLLPAAIFAQEEWTNVELTDAGTLETTLGDSKYSVTKLKVSGPINSSDIATLRDVCGVKGISTKTDGKVAELDLTNANIVAGGTPYMTVYGTPMTTETDVLGDYAFLNLPCTSIALPANLKALGAQSLAGCTNLLEINLPTTLERIGLGCFINCIKVKEMVLPDNVKEIGDGLFQRMDGLKSVNMGEGIDSIPNSTFLMANNLEDVNIGCATRFDAIIFFNTPGLKNIYCSDNNTAFASEDGILYSKDKSVLISYTPGREAFAYEVPSFVKKLGKRSFMYSALEEVTIPGNVEEIGEDAFCNNANLTSINLNEGLRTLRLGAFTSCTALSEIMLPASLETIEGAVFFDCSALSSIGIDEANPYFVTKDGILYSRDLKRFICLPSGMPVEDFTIPESVETMEAYCCSGHASLVTVIVPKNVTTIGENAFSYCPNMIGCVIEENVDSIGQTIFAGCEKMENVFMLAKTPAKHVHQLGIYSDELYDHGMLYVPQESLDLYKEQYWVVYREDDVSDNVVKTIKGMTDAEIAELRGEDPETGIATPATQQAGPTKAYDLQGRRLTNLTKGLQIITLPDGTSKKVIR